MFGTIRKHSNWLWAIIIVFVGVGMVIFFSPDVHLTGIGNRTGDYGSINGRPVTHAEYINAFNEARIAQFLYTGQWPGGDDNARQRLENETLSRVFLIQKLKEMGIKASDKAVAVMVHEQLREYSYSSLEKEILQPQGLSLADYDRFVRNETALRQLIATASVSSRLITPAEAESLWRKENQEILGQAAVFWTSNYLDKVVITNGAIGTFYTNQMNFRYRLPERITLSYVAFEATNFLAEADSKLAQLTNLNEIVSDYYFRGRANTNAWTDTNGNPLPEAAAKEKIKEEIRLSEALMAARRAATAFGNLLTAQADPNKVATFENLAVSNKLTVRVTLPFDRNTGLEEFDNQVQMSRTDDPEAPTLRDIIREKAFALSDDRPVLFNPIPGKDAVYLIARKGKVPSELQPLDKIRDKVTADYKTFMALDLARKAAQSFHTNLTNGLALKKSFAELCTAEKVKTIDLPPFSAGTRNLTNVDERISLRMLQSVAHDTEVGKASQMLPAQPSTEGAFIFYAKARPAIDEAKMKTDLPTFINQMRVYRQNEAFQQWFRKQVEQAKVIPPKRETEADNQAQN